MDGLEKQETKVHLYQTVHLHMRKNGVRKINLKW